ncbi:TMV resistance protein N-like [Dorcoceras hygrometricum]|uniref:TMV resistance protein N-like n=1 Tax=Dorcoceras hygrometricum TaxID=472368 RepID=A0A2Z7A829_9LAMI|nr:TMV resistance protein N-like [Dorcoceras hygrometricum]
MVLRILGRYKFFSVAIVMENEVISAVQGKFVGISEEQFSSAFGLPIAGLTNMTEVPKYLVYDARSIISDFGEPAGSFDVVTHERFLLMTAIHFGLKINWSKILFDIFKEMMTKSSKQAKGFAAQICVLLKSAPNLTGRGEDLPTTKILTVKTVGTYVAKNKNITANEDEPVEKVVKKAAAKRRPAPAVVEPAAKKKRTTTEKDTEKEATVKVKSVAEIIDSTDIEPLSKALELTEKSTSDEESMSKDDILKQISEEMMLPSTMAEEPTKINLDAGLRSWKWTSTRKVFLRLMLLTRGRRSL